MYAVNSTPLACRHNTTHEKFDISFHRISVDTMPAIHSNLFQWPVWCFTCFTYAAAFGSRRGRKMRTDDDDDEKIKTNWNELHHHGTDHFEMKLIYFYFILFSIVAITSFLTLSINVTPISSISFSFWIRSMCYFFVIASSWVDALMCYEI